MAQRRLLFLDASKLTAYTWQGGQLRTGREFIADAAGVEAFEKYLEKNAKSIFSILADVAEEGFQIEDVPFVRGRDRAAISTRRLAQYFYGTPYSLSISLGRDKGGRRDEKMLFAALTQPRYFESWLAAMNKVGIQLAGIYSAPMSLAALITSSRKMKGPELVLSMTRSGVRQTFFNDGNLYFSRLATLATDGLEEAAIAYAVEAQKIYQYLAGQRLIDRNAALNVLVLAHPAQINVIRAHCKDSTELHFEYLDLLAEASKAKFKSTISDSNCETLLLHQLVQKAPEYQFAPPAERHFYQLWRIRTAVSATAVVLFCACLIYAGKQYFSGQTLTEQTQNFETSRRTDQAKYDAALKALPQLPISTDDMRTVVTRFEELNRHSPLLESMLVPLSKAMDATPDIEIQHINWKLTDKLPTTTLISSGAFKQQPLNLSGTYYAVADIDAQMSTAQVNDYRAMLQVLNQFAQEISKDNSVAVQVTQLPINEESGKTIKSSADTSISMATAPKFSFRLIQAF